MGGMGLSHIYAMVLQVVESSVLVLATLFPIVNPIGSAAVFQAMVGELDIALQHRLAKRIAVYGFALLFFSMLLGSRILYFFGISLYSVQIGGGLLVAATGWRLLNKDAQKDQEPIVNADEIMAQAFYPYTLPITVGPGAIAVAVALGAHLPSQLQATSFFSPLLLAASLIGCAIICAIVYICYRWSRAATQMLGKSGTTVLMRLSSFILFCIGVQILTSGIHSFYLTLR